MLRTTLIAGLIAAGTSAYAQTSVTIYGVVDTGIEHLTDRKSVV